MMKRFLAVDGEIITPYSGSKALSVRVENKNSVHIYHQYCIGHGTSLCFTVVPPCERKPHGYDLLI